MAESFSREKLRHAPQKEGGRQILCDLPPVTPAGTSNELDVQNEWEENTHTLYNCTAVLFNIKPHRLRVDLEKKRICTEF